MTDWGSGEATPTNSEVAIGVAERAIQSHVMETVQVYVVAAGEHEATGQARGVSERIRPSAGART